MIRTVHPDILGRIEHEQMGRFNHNNCLDWGAMPGNYSDNVFLRRREIWNSAKNTKRRNGIDMLRERLAREVEVLRRQDQFDLARELEEMAEGINRLNALVVRQAE